MQIADLRIAVRMSISCGPLWTQFGEEPFERGNLDAGRLSWLCWVERWIEAEKPFDPESYEALLQDKCCSSAMVSFPEVFDEDYEGSA